MRTLYEWFDTAADRYPHRTALEMAGERLSYLELRERACRVAASVADAHGGRPDRVALVASRSLDAYAGYLAIQRLGASAVPLNPGYPQQRNLDVAQRAGVQVALVEQAAEQLFTAIPKRHRPATVVLNGEHPQGGELPPVPTDGEREAYLLFTSGSTGQPKGVPVKQRHICPNISYSLERYEVGPDSRLSQVFALTFDGSVLDMFLAWGAGATLVVPSQADLYRPVDFIVDNGLTHWFSVPSVIRIAQQFGNLPIGRATNLRHTMFGAEALTTELVLLWREVAPNSRFHNLYGPTEIAVTCADSSLSGDPDEWYTPSNGTVPIGALFPHLEGVLLGEDGRPADEGELCVRGSQRFDGYLDPHENANRFVSFERDGVGVVYTGDGPLTAAHWYRTGDRIRLEHGQLVHRGRLDQQVKIMGYRVEIGEVEAAMQRHPDVIDALVVAAVVDEETQLFAAYTGSEIPAGEFDDWLREQIPPHMVPSHIEYLEQLPLNDNGKKDRKRLAELFA